MPPHPAIEQIKQILGSKGWADEDGMLAPHLVDSRGSYQGRCLGLALPATTEEVSRIVTLCAHHRIPIVPQGGNTGRVGGATPDETGTALLINLSRMNNILEIDPEGHAITVEAGCILQNIQQAAADADRFFPLSLGAEGSCQIGGNLASNAGGINVLRYGNTRDLVLGLEAVMPDGRVMNALTALRKDNTGYDLKHLLIGSEGTLGIITKAVLRLFPRPTSQATAFCALDSLDSAVDLLGRARADSGDAVSSFELIPARAVEFASRHVPNTRPPLDDIPDWCVLLEFSGSGAAPSTNKDLESFLEGAFEAGLITDAMIAQNEGQRSDLWRLREAIVAAQKPEGASIKHDISVPVQAVPAFIRQANEAVTEACPGIRPYPFGHVGDGNIHYNLSQPEGMAPAAFKAREEDLHRIVYDITQSLGGSISAEHGIGRKKRDDLARYGDPVSLDLMRAIKKALDPDNIMNPGILLPTETNDNDKKPIRENRP
ncbi:FAD-binding oxidoreductase [Aestuariispira insulae]|uniref:4-phosphoerythronate dehydrogenase (FAD-dependent) n=1 Tax=Aestuariispira insulae TaxID=1461337 RepID=A0A3D9HSB9_9PROT|nr:FAD-binding oxidoreductase [Aestuariispira insulae]RED52231.1 4-phosphoerythronate dehydrogenase (FAD-dependent) [Aestuariispira insulae]